MDQTTPHPNAKIWLIVTIIVVIIGLAIAGYFIWQGKLASKSKTTTQPTPAKQETKKEPEKPVTVSKDTKPKTVAN